MRTLFSALAALAASLAVTACGGGSSGDGGMTPLPPPPPPTVVPDSVMATTTALVSYLSAEPAGDETSEALALPMSDAAASDTDEPLPVS